MSEDISFYEKSEKGTMTVREAGRLGGLSLLHKRGKTHFSEIGKKGQLVTRSKYPGMASVWGKMGGRPKKGFLYYDTGEQGKKQ